MDPKVNGDNATIHKEMLRQRILTKRKDRGEEDIDTRPVKITKPELTPEDIEKRDRRKEQNRKAATKFRNKKKIILDAKQQERADLIQSNTELECKIAELLKALDTLKETYSRHMESGCCLISGHNPDNPGSNHLDTSTVDSDTSDLNPRESGLNLGESSFDKETSDFSLARSVLNPDTSGLNPDTSDLIPDTPELNPDSLGLNQEATQSQNLIDVISDLILDLSPNVLESLTNSTTPQPPYQMFYDNSAVNDLKMPVASPHHDQFQLSADCCLDNEFDISMNAQNDQVSMFQYIQSQFSPVSVENEEHLEPWLPRDESLEQRSFTNL